MNFTEQKHEIGDIVRVDGCEWILKISQIKDDLYYLINSKGIPLGWIEKRNLMRPGHRDADYFHKDTLKHQPGDIVLVKAKIVGFSAPFDKEFPYLLAKTDDGDGYNATFQNCFSEQEIFPFVENSEKENQ